MIGNKKLAIIRFGPELNVEEKDLENIENINNELEDVSNDINSEDKNYGDFSGINKEVQNDDIDMEDNFIMKRKIF